MAKTKPIMFSTPMVKAVLEGRKTMMRRVIKPQPKCGLVYIRTAEKRNQHGKWVYSGEYDSAQNGNRQAPENFTDADKRAFWRPKFYAEDILWIKENWLERSSTEMKESGSRFLYRADYDSDCGLKWRSLSTMPFEAARVFLRVTQVRVERLQDITNEDAESEGVCYSSLADFGLSLLEYAPSDFKPRYPFAFYWNSMRRRKTQKKPFPAVRSRVSELNMYGWDANPWVWVISFERCENPEDAIVKGRTL